MKKLQCEVCGSTDIKKNTEDLFECQNCGVQYSKNEVQKLLVELTGEVKIDRSEEIDNLLKRAERFAQEGNSGMAEQYYNKILDLDPDNIVASNAIQSINENNILKKQNAENEEKRRSSSIKILKHTLDPNDGVSVFLKALKNAPAITPDIYKEIEIMSVKQGYYPFSAVDKQYSGNYEAIACYRKQVPYTAYETKTDWHNKNQDGSYKKEQVAVTRYREEIERKNVNGSFTVDHFGVFSIGQELNETITSISADKYDEAISSDKYFDDILGADIQKVHYNDVILQLIENEINANYKTLKSSLIEVNTFDQKSIDGLEIFNESASPAWEDRITALFRAEIDEKAEEKVKNLIPGDFYENARYKCSESYKNVQTVYLPIQIIEYAYRGKFYLSAILLTNTNSIFYSYPCNIELESAKSQKQKSFDNIKKRSMPSGIITLYGLMATGIIVPIWIAATEGVEDIGGFLLICAMIIIGLFGVPAVLWHIFWRKKKNKELKTEVLGGTEYIEVIENKFKTELTNEYTAFFKVFTDPASIENSAAAAKKVSGYNADVSLIKGRTSTASGSRSATRGGVGTPTNDAIDTNGQDLTNDCLYKVCLVNSGVDKLTVCKVLRETCNIGLADAKEIADTPHSVVAGGLSARDADSLTSKLTMAGATVEIKRET